ncbi:WAT1-related protein At1g09380-like [Rhododendron vialii]|uniref:WAT1-related protein At1g09380-like n=1 Tax=Rhododendron vialii TaxID=182163 RepID=UPI00265FADFC|nr:WAT1-related protein At1g09380-like [Rhododendron vialii]
MYFGLNEICRATLYQVLYFVGLDHSTPTIACALSNLEPVLTFLLAIPFGLESVGIGKKAGQAKVLGTVVCVGGAMLLSFYHGSVVMGSIHWKYANNMGKGNSSSTTNDKKFMWGPFLLIAIKAKLGLNYSAPYTTSALICLMASIESGIIGINVVRYLSTWSLSPIIRVVSTLYAATVCTALAFCLIAWCVKRKGPLYVSVFSPLLLIVVAILNWMLLQEKLYVGTVVGSVLIVKGLYTVIWGKKREKSDEQWRG